MNNSQLKKVKDQKNLELDKILFIVVIYKTKLNDGATWKTFLSKLNLFDLVIYDNSPYPLHNSGELGSNVIYYNDKKNGGLSKAYNFAAECAMDMKKEWLFLLDQDTSFPLNAIEYYLRGIQSYPAINLFIPFVTTQQGGQILSPNTFGHIFSKKTIKPGINNLYEFSAINSGMLINVETFYESGGYEEDVYLDFADYQFLEKFRKISEKFVLLNFTAVQNFSNDEHNYKNLANRFEIYSDCAYRFRKENLRQNFFFFLITLKHALSLTFRTKRLTFLTTYLNSFIRPSLGMKK
jgi:GT2 family glycosyltransferase